MRAATEKVFSSWKFVFVLVLLTGTAAYADTPPTWSQAGSFAGRGEDGGTAMKVDQAGNQYVTGFFSGTAMFNGQILASRGDTDIFFAKFSPDGSLLWLVQAGGVGHDEGSEIAIDATGNVYLTGWFTDRAKFGSVDGTVTTGSGTGETIFLAKYSTSGNVIWLREGTVNAIHVNRGNGLAINPVTGSIFLTGVSQGTTSFSSADGAQYQVSGPESWHMYLVKYDGAGQFHWGESNEASPNSIPNKVAVDGNDNAYVTGWFEGVVTFHSHNGQDQTVVGLSGPVQSAPDYPDDSFLVKYDGRGNLQWVNDIGGYKAIANDVAVSSDGEVSITGMIGNIDYGSATQAETIVTSQPPGSNVSLGGGHFTNPYNRDVFLARYGRDGRVHNAARIGSANQDSGSGVAYDDLGNLYVSGVLQRTTIGGTQTNNLFVLKCTADSLAWAVEADGAGTDQFLNGPRVGTTPDGSAVFVTGRYQGTAKFGGITMHSAGADDIFTMELK